MLVRHFMRRAEPDRTVTVEREVDELLLRHVWPGNVRELQNIVERMMVLRDGDVIRATDVPPAIRHEAGASAHVAGDLPFELPEDGLDLESFERTLILAVLAKLDGNKSAAARYLNIPRHVLLYRLQKYGLA